MTFRLVAAALLLLVGTSAMAQLPLLERGDVLVSTLEGTPQGVVTKVVAYTSSGVRKGELTASLRDLRETLYKNGVVYVATETGIERIAANGQRVPDGRTSAHPGSATSRFPFCARTRSRSESVHDLLRGIGTFGDLEFLRQHESCRVWRDLFGFDPECASLAL
jgi:hypothetical protein